MDRYMKAFVVMSMVYLFAGSALGVWLCAHDPSMDVRFAHVHLNLLGFMAMMIFGVGYFILPRFAGRTLRWPGLVAVHFWTSNLSLWGMVLSHSACRGGFFVLLGCSGGIRRPSADPEHVERARKLGVNLGMMAKRHSLIR